MVRSSPPVRDANLRMRSMVDGKFCSEMVEGERRRTRSWRVARMFELAFGDRGKEMSCVIKSLSVTSSACELGWRKTFRRTAQSQRRGQSQRMEDRRVRRPSP